MSDYKLVPNLQQIVTDALVGTVSGVTQMVPPADEPLPDFIQATIDRAVTRIRSEIDLHAAAAPAPVERNQCDGCQAGIPVENGMHRMGKPDGYPDLMLCTADRYSTPQQPAPDVAALVEALEWLRGAINATPENDNDRTGTWISTKHPRIKQIDAIIAAHRKQGGEV